MLAKCVLASPSAGHGLRWREIRALVKTRIQRWLDGDLVALWSESVAGAQSPSKRSSSASPRSINVRRAKMATQEGQYGKAIKALTSDGLATPSDSVFLEMLAKHPQSGWLSIPSILSRSQLFVKVSNPSLMALPLVLLACVQATSRKLWDVPLLTRLTKS